MAPVLVPDLLARTAAALPPVAALLAAATEAVRALVAPKGRIDAAVLEQHQSAAHGLAWLATYGESLQAVAGLGQAAGGRGPVRRDRGADPADRRSANTWRRSPAGSR